MTYATRMKLGLAAAVAAMATAPYALAEDGKSQSALEAQVALFDRYLAEREGQLPCYATTISDEEREANPGRQVSRFAVRHSRSDELDDAPEVFELVFLWSLNSATTWAAVEAQCSMDGDAADCLVEGDGASYRLSADGDNLAFTAGALNIEIMDALTEWFGDPSMPHTITLTISDPSLCEMT
jgi:hypothetical protein